MDRNYIEKDQSVHLFALLEEIIKMLNKLIGYLANSDIRGQKFKGRGEKVG